MVRSLDVEEFLRLPGIALDVRSPGEFLHAPITGAYSLPLFTDEERAQVGTVYKQVGRDASVELGLRLVGPRFADMVAQARAFTEGQTAKVYCWRGGMRSGAVAWLLETAGIPSVTLKGGYKRYRHRAVATLEAISHHSPPLVVLGGLTGAGKTEILHALAATGEQILDLEGLANHRGSAFGSIGMPIQPSNEHFENEIARSWTQFDPARRLWIEDESRQLGQLRLPSQLFNAILQAPVIIVERPIEERVAHLLEMYGAADPASLITATKRLEKRLGGQCTQEIVDAIKEGCLASAIQKSLKYYDAAYFHGLKNRKAAPFVIQKQGFSALQWAECLKAVGPASLG